MEPTMLERYGGTTTVREIVATFYAKVLLSPVVSPYFRSTDLNTLIEHQVRFISQLMGGPVAYSNEALARSHARLAIDERAFREVLSLLAKTLAQHGMNAEDTAVMTAKLESLAPHIVTR